MIIITDFVRPLIKARCLKAKAFIEAHHPFPYCIVPKGRQWMEGSLFMGTYKEEPFEQRDYATALTLPGPGDAIVLSLGLSDAMFLLSLLALEPGWLRHLRNADPYADDEAAIHAFGVDLAQVCRPAVGAWEEGYFLAPDAGGYAFFYVDIRGNILMQSRSHRLLAVGFHLVAKEAAEAAKLASKLGQTDPAPDDTA